jgi:hypothetical protein
MTDYRERLVRRAARTAARQTMILQRVNNAFSESVEARRRSLSLEDIAANFDTLNRAQSVYVQNQAQPIIRQLPNVISQAHDMMEGSQ